MIGGHFPESIFRDTRFDSAARHWQNPCHHGGPTTWTEWSRKQYAEAETKLDEAVSILDELWREESKAFANRPIGWQRSQAGEAEQARLHLMHNLIHELH